MARATISVTVALRCSIGACIGVVVALLSVSAWAICAPFAQTEAGVSPERTEVIELVSIVGVVTPAGTFEVTHVLRNTADEPVALTVGCPKRGSRQFDPRVRGVAVSTRVDSGISLPSDLSNVNTDLRYRTGEVQLFDVRFAPNEEIEVRHTIVIHRLISSRDWRRSSSFYLPMSRAALWSGDVGRAFFTVRFSEPGVPSWTSGFDVKWQRSADGLEVKLEATDWAPGPLGLRVTSRSDATAIREIVGGPCPKWVWKDNDTKNLPPPEQEKLARENWRELMTVVPLTHFSTARLEECRNAVYARHGYPFGDEALRDLFYRPPVLQPRKDGDWRDRRRVEIDVEVTNPGETTMLASARVEPVEDADIVPVAEIDFAVSPWRGRVARVVASLASSNDDGADSQAVNILPGTSGIVSVQWDLPDGWWWANGYFNFDLLTVEEQPSDGPRFSAKTVDVRNARFKVRRTDAFYQLDPDFSPSKLSDRDWAYIKRLRQEERRRHSASDSD